MEKNQIGTSNLFISPITLGGMSLGVEKRKATYMIDEALANGINHIDTADLYDFGTNEEIVGEAIRKKRHDTIITTKVGNHFDPNKKDWFWDPTPTYINQAIDNSLQRLGTDYIDLYLLHGGTIEDPIDDIIDTFERLKENGKIRAYGISSIRPNVIHTYLHKSHIDAIMMQYNLLDRRPEELFSSINEKNVSILARGPLAKGILSNQSTVKLREKGEDGYLSYTYEELLDMITALQNIDTSLSTLAFQYILQQRTVCSAVFGSSSLQQLNENLLAFTNKPLDSHQYDHIQQITKAIKYENHRI